MYEVPLEQSMQRQLLLDANFAGQLVDWGDLPQSPEGVYAGVQDGSVARNHPELGRPRASGEPTRLGFATYADDVEIVNPIGYARVKHKVTLHYLTILNQEAHVRSHLDNIFLIGVVLSKDQSAVGVHTVLQGGHKSAATRDEEDFSFAATLRKFGRPEGISFAITDWGGQGVYSTRFRGFLLLVIADTLAAAELIGFKKGFTEKVFRPCWQCYCKGELSHPQAFSRVLPCSYVIPAGS